MNIFRVEFWERDSYKQEYFRCPKEAGDRAKMLMELPVITCVTDVTITTVFLN